VTTIALHVAAMSIWIGGLVALVVLSRRDREVVVQSLPRFSGLALLCFVAVGSSGVVGALTRVRTGEGLWDTSYGRVILLKAVLFVLLGVFGLVQRRRVLARPAGSDPLPGSRTSAEFRRLARAELALMLVTVAVGVGLSRTPPPVG
jgi:putative copper resistance protein D